METTEFVMILNATFCLNTDGKNGVAGLQDL